MKSMQTLLKAFDRTNASSMELRVPMCGELRCASRWKADSS